jgi:hypothetical protein
MKQIALLLLALAVLPGVAGCTHIYGEISTLQDTKYPVTHKDKIAVPDTQNAPEVNLPTRLAGDTVNEQLRALGFTIAPAADADLQINYTVADKSVPMTFGVTVPTISNTMGDINGRPINGTTFGDTVVPETRNVNRTTLALTLQRLSDPKVIVWQGNIQADTADAQQYRAQFFRALLSHIGETVNGEAPLDVEIASPKQP